MDITKLRERAKTVKMIISDMDGSLLNSKKQISDRNAEAAARVRAAGYDFTIATGRMGDTLDEFLMRLGIKGYFISTNGAEIMDPSGKVLMRKTISEESAERVYFELDRAGIPYYLESVCRYWVRAGSPLEGMFIEGHKQALSGNARFKLNRFEGSPAKQLKGQQLLKILVGYRNEAEYQTITDIAGSCEGVDYTASGAGIIEIVPAGCDKGTALQTLASALGLRQDEICAIGDFDNDISMLKFVGIAVAMGNSRPAVREIADYITESNDNDGVAFALEALFL